MRLYPRLPADVTLQLLAELRETPISQVPDRALLDHPRAIPLATGGRIVSRSELETVRAEVLDAVGPLGEGTAGQYAAFDRALGRSLHQSLALKASEAGQESVWEFLSLLVLPDVVVHRFPSLPDHRVLGKGRNALRRAWLRFDLLGDLIDHDSALQEDEMVQIVERTALVRNRRLAIGLAHAIVRRPQRGREAFTRELVKNVSREGAHRLLDVLDDAEMEQLIEGHATRATRATWSG